jgi:hypothetical protein
MHMYCIESLVSYNPAICIASKLTLHQALIKPDLLITCTNMIAQMRWDDFAPVPQTKVRLDSIPIRHRADILLGLSAIMENHSHLFRWRRNSRQGQILVPGECRRKRRTWPPAYHRLTIRLPSFQTRDHLKVSCLSTATSIVCVRA